MRVLSTISFLLAILTLQTQCTSIELRSELGDVNPRPGYELPPSTTGWLDSGFCKGANETRSSDHLRIDPKTGKRRLRLGCCLPFFRLFSYLPPPDRGCCRSIIRDLLCRTDKGTGPVQPVAHATTAPPEKSRLLASRAIDPWIKDAPFQDTTSAPYHPREMGAPRILPRKGTTTTLMGWQLPANTTGWVENGRWLLNTHQRSTYAGVDPVTGRRRKPETQCRLGPETTQEEWECCVAPIPHLVRQYCRGYEWRSDAEDDWQGESEEGISWKVRRGRRSGSAGRRL